MKRILLTAIIILCAISCTMQKIARVDIVPYPNSVTLKSGVFNIAGSSVYYDAAFDDMTAKAVARLCGQLSLVTGEQFSASEGTSGNGIVFIKDDSISDEAYSLKISKNGIKVKAASLNGVLYAIQTIKQMLPVEVYGSVEAADKDWTLPCCMIEDAPRFAYRGEHLDEARHFYGMEEVKKILDLMEIHKMNTLHWHLTDDQGWRVEIKQYPKLTEVGSIRKETLVGHINWSRTFDGKPYGEGKWYSQEQIKEIIEYAAERGIDIIPEIDLPGHMLAALTAYPELGCTGGPYEVWGMWGVAEDVLCAGKEEVMVFLENVLAEVADLFPSEYIHIGGDECPKVRWEKCPHCQAKIKELGLKDDDRFHAEHYLQSYVMKRMSDFLGARGKKVIGWDEILEGERIGQTHRVGRQLGICLCGWRRW